MVVVLSFTREQFIGVFVEYHLALWPLQIFAYVIGIGMVAMVFRPSPISGRMIAGGLAAMWLWTGIAYHGLYFSSINGAALLFGVLFVLQGALIFYVGVVRAQLQFGIPDGVTGWLGGVLMTYAAVLYPLLGIWFGHTYAQVPMFGMTPCPVTIFSFGLLLLASVPVPLGLVAVPFLWTLVGGSAAFLLGIPQDWLLLFTGFLAVPLLILRGRRLRSTAVTRPSAQNV
jgi:hypothetical protein